MTSRGKLAQLMSTLRHICLLSRGKKMLFPRRVEAEREGNCRDILASVNITMLIGANYCQLCVCMFASGLPVVMPVCWYLLVITVYL